jgi:hypothetical protein
VLGEGIGIGEGHLSSGVEECQVSDLMAACPPVGRGWLVPLVVTAGSEEFVEGRLFCLKVVDDGVDVIHDSASAYISGYRPA